MKKYQVLYLLLLMSMLTGTAQQTTAKGAFLEKWENSKNYLLAIAEAMPEVNYDFKPTERQMSFEEQLLHIQRNMEWLSTSYFGKKESEIGSEEISKDQVIKYLNSSFDATKEVVANTSEEELKESIEFFAGEKSKLQILNLLQDHVTHHRGQLIVYLNLNDIKPPTYVGW
jgi:uncharacterized damage-inducible protein DinB